MPNEAAVRTIGHHPGAADPASIMSNHLRAGVAEMRLGLFSGSGLLDLASQTVRRRQLGTAERAR